MIAAEIRLYDLLKAKLGQDTAETFVEVLESKVEKKFDDKKAELATKEDIAKLEAKIESSLKDQLKWMIVLMVSFFPMLVAVIKFL